MAANVLQLTEGGIDNCSTLALSFLPLLVRCCYLLAVFQPKMFIRSTKRTFFNFLKGRFLYFISLIISTLRIVNNFVYKNMQLNCHRIEIKHIFTSDLKTSKMKKQLMKELKEMMKQGKGYLTVKNFIKDFELTNASVSELEAESTSWTLTIVSGHKYQYFTGLNFGW